MATVTPLTLQRSEELTAWGFRLEGGADYKRPLRIKKVSRERLQAPATHQESE